MANNRKKEKFNVVFNECASLVLGVSKSLYRSYDTMEEVVYSFRLANNMRMISNHCGEGICLISSSETLTDINNEQ
ncbi:hypothetical protein MANES_13G077718v8 [Manihot esculenta]|uniref:Uncharacterized protein n=1 Tax=Manihot esculenta TaxID=3983 RepID=A0ACB7GKI2_MANES|nr:hypothetical protein MANES_13G077718v8 [Manihot esculenta]